MYKQVGAGGGAGLDRKRISDVLDKHLEKSVASPSTSRGSAGGGGGRDHQRLLVPSSVSSMPKGCSEGDVTRSFPPPFSFSFRFRRRRDLVACRASVPVLVRS